MVCYAVIDTNVIVAAVLAKNEDAATTGVLRAVFDGRITPLYHADILHEYEEVLRREKFHLQEETIQKILLGVNHPHLRFAKKWGLPASATTAWPPFNGCRVLHSVHRRIGSAGSRPTIVFNS